MEELETNGTFSIKMSFGPALDVATNGPPLGAKGFRGGIPYPPFRCKLWDLGPAAPKTAGMPGRSAGRITLARGRFVRKSSAGPRPIYGET